MRFGACWAAVSLTVLLIRMENETSNYIHWKWKSVKIMDGCHTELFLKYKRAEAVIFSNNNHFWLTHHMKVKVWTDSTCCIFHHLHSDLRRALTPPVMLAFHQTEEKFLKRLQTTENAGIVVIHLSIKFRLTPQNSCSNDFRYYHSIISLCLFRNRNIHSFEICKDQNTAWLIAVAPWKCVFLP